ncbi:MAG: type 1 glutamine amidotransferase [Ktedonobacterales bacterium]
MRPVLVIENAPDAPAGLVGQIMQSQGIDYDVVNVPQGKIPEVEDSAALVILGGPQHVGNYEQYPYFASEELLIQKAISKDIPCLGICLGGQLLAHSLGARVGRHHVAEVGFSEVQLTEAGANDPLFRGLPNPQLVFQWHVDAFALPESAVLLATSLATPNQAFSYAGRAYGLQYHVEVLPEIFELWLHEETSELDEVLGSDAIADLSRGWHSSYATYREQSTLMIYNFLRVAELL